MTSKHSTNQNGTVGKICNKCKTWYPLEEFIRNKNNGDGLDYWCKHCKKEYYENNKKIILKRGAEYRQTEKGKQVSIKSQAKYRKSKKGKLQIHKLISEKQKILDNIKMQSGCVLCGFCKYPESLDFHHINPEDKKYYIDLHSMSKDDVIEEIQKCMILCKNCHAHITKISMN